MHLLQNIDKELILNFHVPRVGLEAGKYVYI